MKLSFKNAVLQLCLSILLLTSCSQTPKPNNTPIVELYSPEQRLQKLNELKQWQVTGKIAFIDAKSRNSASLIWQVNELEGSQQLKLSTYLGINLLTLESKNNVHQLNVDGKNYQGERLDELIHSLTGLTIPTDALTYWLKAMPYNAEDALTYGEKSSLPISLHSEYNNEHWQIVYGNYKAVNGYHLPSNVSIKQGELTIKIAIYDWVIN